VTSIIPLHVDTSYLDAAFEEAKKRSQRKQSSASGIDGDGTFKERDKPLNVQVMKRETEQETQARLSSYAYLKRKIDDEPWVQLKVFVEGSEESNYLANQLVATQDTSGHGGRIQIVKGAKEYLDMLAN
jgi:hypothetical protein